MVSLGNAIRNLRKAGGLTQRSLATRVGVSPTYLSHVEAGRREPSVTLLRGLARELAVPPGIFLAILLSADLPRERREEYQAILSRLFEIATESASRS
jgi:transcriptional regulator with XRE-family HTH domain